MSHFPQFVEKFNKFRDNYGLEMKYIEAKKYGWRIGSDAKADLEVHIEEVWPEAEQKQKDNFRLMFQQGRDLLGIQILSIMPGTKMYLLELNEKTYSTSFEIYQFWENKIHNQPQVKCPVLNSNFYWPIDIKIESLNITDSNKEYFDINEDSITGAITYNSIKFPHNDNKVYVNGKINYKSGILTVTRFSKKNDETYDKLLAKQSGGGSGSGSGSGSGGGSGGQQEILYKEKDILKVSYTTYVGPVKKIFEYDINE
jgi:hypothetical protein